MLILALTSTYMSIWWYDHVQECDFTHFSNHQECFTNLKPPWIKTWLITDVVQKNVWKCLGTNIHSSFVCSHLTEVSSCIYQSDKSCFLLQTSHVLLPAQTVSINEQAQSSDVFLLKTVCVFSFTTEDQQTEIIQRLNKQICWLETKIKQKVSNTPYV